MSEKQTNQGQPTKPTTQPQLPSNLPDFGNGKNSLPSFHNPPPPPPPPPPPSNGASE